MSTPSRSCSFARGKEGYFEWRDNMERQQRENERQVQALLQETRRLRAENDVLRIQVSSEPPCYQQPRNSCFNQEAMHPRDASPPLDAHAEWPREAPRPICHEQWEESSDSTRVSSKRQREKRPQISDVMRARLGPQAPSKNRPYSAATPASHPRPSASPISQGHATHQPVLRVGRDPLNAAPPGSISKRIDDMFSTPFSSRIINYEPPQGFIIPKFSTYDGSSDPFDHIMHYRQLMTIDIGNDMLLCKVFPTSLQGQALSWFHRLPMNSVDNFRDLFEVFVGQHLYSTRHKQNINTLQNIKIQENETLREFVKRFGQVVLQVESYNMDVVLQIFKRSICPGTLFFESLAKKLPITMDDLFQRANKYSMLEDDVRAATQQVLVAGQAARNDTTRNFKPSSQQGPSNRGQVE